MRKPKKAHPENHERWLVSYADFITLLFAFFVVMFASSQTDKGRAKQISAAVTEALKEGHTVNLPPAVARILGGTVDDLGQGNAQMKGPGGTKAVPKEAQPGAATVVELVPSMQMLTSQMEQEIKDGKVEVSMQPRGLVVSLKQAAFFPSGTEAVDPAALEIVGKIAQAVTGMSNAVRIEGHTDAIPIHTPRFHSNWELSAARAISMMEALATRFSLPYTRMAIVGYADTSPIASNDTPEGRARNRRVDIVILNNYALKQTEPPVREK